MGLIRTAHGRRNYVAQLERHGLGEVELPVERLDAIFLEGTDVSKDPRKVTEMLKRKDLLGKAKSIILRAKKTGSEIWFGDLNTTDKEDNRYYDAEKAVAVGGVIGSAIAAISSRRAFLKTLGVLGGTVAIHSITHEEILNSQGNAKERKISRALISAYGKPFSIIDLRNRVMAHQIKTLAEKSGHTNIGAIVGAAHVDITNMLEQGRELTEAEKQEIRQRYKEAGRMMRCVYDKTAERWRVEKYQL